MPVPNLPRPLQQSDPFAQGLPSRARREHARERSSLRAASRPRLLRQGSRSFSVCYSKSCPVTAADLLPLLSTCAISSTSLLGSAVTIGDSSTITRSVLSNSVIIGANCRIINSYLFAGAVVGDGCEIRDSVLGEGARVENGCVVESGSLVAGGAVLGQGTKLVGRRVSLEEPVEDDAEEEEEEGICKWRPCTLSTRAAR